jgi:hypothetical protein
MQIKFSLFEKLSVVVTTILSSEPSIPGGIIWKLLWEIPIFILLQNAWPIFESINNAYVIKHRERLMARAVLKLCLVRKRFISAKPFAFLLSRYSNWWLQRNSIPTSGLMLTSLQLYEIINSSHVLMSFQCHCLNITGNSLVWVR